MKVVFEPECLNYNYPGHPESSRRVELILTQLKKDPKFIFVNCQKAEESDLLLVHDQQLIDQVKNNSFSDPDTPNIKSIYYYALLSARSAVLASDLVLSEQYVFTLNRPPGHHATHDRVGGFCYFNNIAAAVAKLLKAEKRMAILDIDVHHGNGTEDIFLGKEEVIYVSIHQIPLYPGSGLKTVGNCYNFPLPPLTKFDEYQKNLTSALEIITDFKPEILAVSLGFDTYKNDPLANIKLEIKDYRLIGQMIKNLKLPTFFVLEGGYSEDIGLLASEFLKSF